MTIGGHDTVIVGSGQATFTLPNGTKLEIQEALLYPDSTRTLLSFKDIRVNGYHIETHEDNAVESLLITQQKESGKGILEILSALSFGLYYTYIKPEQHLAYKIIFQNLDKFKIWHDRLGHPGVGMMRKIIDGSMMTHKYRGPIVVLLISKSVKPNGEQKEMISGFQQGILCKY